MHRLLYSQFVIFSSPYVYAQSEVADEVATLRQLIEEQNRLLIDQSAQLKPLTQRVAAPERQTGVTGGQPRVVVDSQTNEVRPDLPTQDEVRTDARGIG